MRLEKCMWLGVLGLGIAGCGGGDKGSGNGGGSFAAISESLAEPTGTVDETTAGDIGEEFEKVSGTGANGFRDEQIAQSQQTQTVSCPAGGNYTITASGSQSSGRATLDYNSCCYAEGCCTDGSGDWYYSSSQTASYSICGSYDLSSSCGGSEVSLEYSGCMSSDGEWVYSIEVDGETYAVSGSYFGGNGSLEIRGANGTWNCTYSNGTGSCTGSGGNFSFD
jgi:hypothetical protein